ncbi:hypothetical protein [Microbispora sp. KK1-11]|uniref:hypothetical protein n=1 Tax=Microbispora sp. KK1-11 TaxID=2053005 RepID=UPI001157D2A2|nr:hypothetical protein [Microbispora sp. KK1-11]TQS25625.1 hypothetical protein FLW16_28935 [Microbispora sp. KK1-11]
MALSAPGTPPVSHQTGVGNVVTSGMVEGQVRGLQERSEQHGESESESIWSFRLERYDQEGNRVMLVPVEMRGRSIEGSINDGDWIRARGSLRSGTLRLSELQNLSTGAIVRAKGIPKAVLIVGIVLFVAVVAWIVFIAVLAIIQSPAGVVLPPSVR